jgi:hypothetical protein
MLGDSFSKMLKMKVDDSSVPFTISLKGLNCDKFYYGNDKQKEGAIFFIVKSALINQCHATES